ncbi:MAG: hypothetical protein A3J38_06380 [Gammaproteobacteria bacterium RIFCSPHIGHO2_12_FULL_45_9]|nr:MAG: hypothetical protein A3J38_06380 [Gammaproteobacteria bacterium RIFCSPHIGHO2_12_FULL_45_9]
MSYISRVQEARLLAAFETPLITGILGPRRVGKSTLIDHYVSQHPEMTYVRLNMDKLAEREQVEAQQLEKMIVTAIRRHLCVNQPVCITIDEAQKCPALFEQVKVLYDQYKDQNAIKFILTGSALLDLHRLSAESLAGRINLYYLSAFNLREAVQLKNEVSFQQSVFDFIEHEASALQWKAYFYELMPYTPLLQATWLELQIWGGLPEVLLSVTKEERLDYLANYLQTYLEKDVRNIESITDLTLYRNLIDIAAEQTGSVRDDTRIVQALHCHRDTLNKYRGYLQATLMYQDVHPYIHSTLKRLVKSPKGYLINNGLVSYLQGISDIDVLKKTGQIGHRIENWFLNELSVWLSKKPGKHSVHYWRTTGGAEVDFVVHKPPYVFPFEITNTGFIERQKIQNLLRFRAYEPKAQWGFYVYGGDFQLDADNKIICIPHWAVC